MLKIREMALPKARNNFALQERIRKLEETFSLSQSVVSGDFTSRLETAVYEVIRLSKAVNDVADLRNKLTNVMFENL